MDDGATIVVSQPRGYTAERAYALEVVLGTLLGLRHVTEEARRDDVMLCVAGVPDIRLRVADVLFATPPEDWLTEAALPATPLARRRLEDGDSLPLLYHRRDPVEDPDPGENWLGVDVFGSVFFMLTRYEEIVRAERDIHGRFPAAASIAVRERFLDRPIVHDYAELLWARLHRLWPRLTRPHRRFRVRPSHDVDWPAMPARTLRATARTVAGDVVRRHDPVLAVDRVRWQVARRRGRLDPDPYDTFDELMGISEMAGVRSAFYFMAGVTDPAFDGGCSLEAPAMGRLLRRIHERGHEIGLHPSYGSAGRPEIVAREFAVLKAACLRLGIEQAGWGGRQHFLRWENPMTWQSWDDAGLDYDSTLTFADTAGFRTGACIEYPVFNLRTRRRLRLRERPLVAMEGALPGSGVAQRLRREDILVGLREQTRRVGGEFTLLWHNSSLLSRHDRDQYRRIMLP